jgi:hypothetical protein
LNWSAQLGKTYHVEYRESLIDSNWLESTGSVWFDGSRAYFMTPASSPTNRFYRIRLE